jgi:hypothetical protein
MRALDESTPLFDAQVHAPFARSATLEQAMKANLRGRANVE